MRTKILKYILDIERIIEEIDSIKEAAERCFEIIGEAVNNLSKLDPETTKLISGIRNIVGLRNLIIHSYDSIDDELLLGIIQKDIPILKEEIRKLKT